MHNALYVINGKETEITADSIESRREYLAKYVGHLYCPHKNCPAQLSYAETPSFRAKKIFKTVKNSSHSDDCPYRILHDENKSRQLTSGVINRALSDEHKRDILKKLYQRNFEEDTSSTASSSPSSKDTQPLPKKKHQGTPTAKVIASLDPDAQEVSEGQREPSVRKRKANDILPEDVGRLLGLDGYITAASIDGNHITFTLTSNLSIYFYNAFHDSNPEAYNLVKLLAENINATHTPVLVCFIGIVESTKTGYQVQIMNPSLITFDNKSILNYNIL